MNSKITDIQSQKKNPTRVNVFVDNQFAFALSRELQILNKVKIDQQLSQETIQQLVFQDQTARLFEKAIKFLSYRPRSEKEIRSNLLQKLKLSDKGEEEKKNFERSIEEVIKKLAKIGQIDDNEFATWWVEQRTKFKKTSPRIIKSELFIKGIDKDLIEKVLAENSADPLELALSAAEKKLSSYRNLEKKDFKIKMSRFLASKGWDWEVINKVVDSLLEKR